MHGSWLRLTLRPGWIAKLGSHSLDLVPMSCQQLPTLERENMRKMSNAS